jgi:hypothetical protein
VPVLFFNLVASFATSSNTAQNISHNIRHYIDTRKYTMELVLCLTAASIAAEVPLYMDRTQPIAVRVADLLPRMNLDEKIAMTFVERASFVLEPKISFRPAINSHTMSTRTCFRS